MTEVERLSGKLHQIRIKIKKNTKTLSRKNSLSKSKLLAKEKIKLEKQEQSLLSDISNAVKKSERDQKKEVKGLKFELQVMERKNDSLQRQVPMMAEEADDMEFEED